jgi:chromate transporter
MTKIANEVAVRPEPVSFLAAFLYWLKLGFISFGGPAGQISMMHQELVEKRRWISEHRFLHALNYTMVLPGPEAQQLATYIGWLMHGAWGGVAAGVLFVLPSFFILIALTWIYLVYGNVPAVEGILYGIKPAVTAIVVFAAYRIGSKTLNNNVLRFMAVLAFLAIFAFDVSFPYIVLMAGIMGYAGSHFLPEKFRSGGHHSESGKFFGPALIDDDTPIPEYAKFKWVRLLSFSLAGITIWGGCDVYAFYSIWLGGYAYSNGLVLHQGCFCYFWWCLCSLALCLSGWRRKLCMVERYTDD